MKNKMIKYMFAVVAMSTAFCACDTPQGSSDSSTDLVVDSSSSGTDIDVNNNVYENPDRNLPTYEETGNYIIENGITNYKVVIPENALTKEVLAKDELVQFIAKSTGVTLQVVNDSEVSYDTTQNYISIGHNKLLESSGIETTREELTYDGFKIIRKGNIVFIAGYSDYGTLYGTYRFLNTTIKFRTYAKDEIYYEKTNEIPLYDYNETNAPAFEERMLSYYEVSGEELYRDRIHVKSHGQNWIYGSHSHFSIMPKATYYNAHPDWYSKDGNQLCLTHPEMKKEFIKNLKTIIQTHPTKDYILLGREDNNTFCNCTSCNEGVAKYGSKSGLDVVFVNSVAEEIENWLKVEDPNRKIIIGTFAYGPTLTSPAVYDETTKTYKPYCDEVKTRDNVIILIAPLQTNYTYSFLDPNNQMIKEAFEGWRVCTKEFAIWTYSANFYSYFNNFMNFHMYAKQYQELHQMGTISIVDQGPWDTNSPTFHELRCYLMSRLMWDPYLDTEDLIDDFLRHYYKEAYSALRKYYDTTKTYLEHLRIKYELDATCYVIYNKIEYWPQSYLNSLMDIFEEAKQAIEPLKEENPTEYETLLNRINEQSLSPRYYMLRFYQNTFTKAEQVKLIDEFEELTKANNITHWAESTNMAQGDQTIASFIKTLRRNIK